MSAMVKEFLIMTSHHFFAKLSRRKQRIFSYFLHPKFSTSSHRNASTRKQGEGNNGAPIEEFIRQKIRATGPLTVAEFMRLSIGSKMGYYAKEDSPIFGEQGDFVTAPEVSQIFGELVALWLLDTLQTIQQKSRDDFSWQLVELGPGSAQLMSDILRSFHKLQVDNVSVHMVETSDPLIARQKALLCEENSYEKTLHNYPIYWHNTLEEFAKHSPKKFTVFLANEFFDALPIHQFQRNKEDNKKWHEIYVTLDQSEKSNADQQQKLCFMLSKSENIHTKTLIPGYIRDNQEIRQWECSADSLKIAAQIADRITECDGFALIFDYGHDGSRRTHSLRAYRRHELSNPLENVGQVDLTADVNFDEMERILHEKSCATFGPTEQRRFLSEVGIFPRLDQLLNYCKSIDERKTLIESTKFLMVEMGVRFKAFSVFPSRNLKDESKFSDTQSPPLGFLSTIMENTYKY